MTTPEEAVMRPWAEYAPWAKLVVQGDEVVAQPAGQQHRWAMVPWPQVRSTQLAPQQVLVAANLGSRLRSRMARDGQSFGDRHVLHLVAAEAVLHLERIDQAAQEPDRPQRATRSLPPGGVRAVMAILADPEKPWTVRRLHEDAGLSVGHAQRILSTLEQADLMVSVGNGPTSYRQVRKPGALLDWLAKQPAARPQPLQWATHVYGRNGREILRRAAQGLAAHCDYAVTGMAAATLSELGPTELTKVHVWIDRNEDLATVAQRAGMKRTTRGSNVVLWSDADGSGRKGSVYIDDIFVAAPVRVYLDLLSLPRGPEVAATYRRVMLGY